MRHESNPGDSSLYGRPGEKIRSEEIQARIEHLRAVGLSTKAIRSIRLFSPTLFRISVVDEMIKGLTERGFMDPVGLIEKHPQILCYQLERIDGIIAELDHRGFENPVGVLEKDPKNLGNSIRTLRAKIKGFARAGFKHPVPFLSKSPKSFGCSSEAVEQKIDFLKRFGFKDPVRLIEIAPAILDLSLENLERKMMIIERLVRLYRIPYPATAIIEKNLPLLSAKEDKLWVLARVALEVFSSPDQATPSVINRFLFANLESLICVSRSKARLTVSELFSIVRSKNQKGIPKETKRAAILAFPKDDKLRRRYLRGYPK